MPQMLGRRPLLIAASSVGVFFLGARRPASVHAAKRGDVSILQPARPGDMAFIARAFEMRRKAIEYGDQEYGAVIVRERIIIGQSWSRVILDQDPSGHAEMSAIRDAARRLNSRDLRGAVIYSSSRPCPMCEAAAYLAGIGKMIHGRKADDAGSPKLCR